MSERATDSTARARMLIDAGRYQDALAALMTELAKDPDDPTVFCLIAQCHLALGDPTRADIAAQNALRLGADNEWPHRLRSIALTRNGRYLEARVEAKRAITAAPWVWRGYVQRATVDCAAHEIDAESWEAAGRAVELAPNEAEAHFALGHVAMIAKRNRLARSEFLEVLRLDPDNAAARNNLAVQSLRSSRFISALKHLVGALRLDPHQEVFHKNLRLVLLMWVGFVAAVGAVGGLPAFTSTERSTWYTTGYFDATGQPVDPTQVVGGNQLIFPVQVAHHGPAPHGWTGPLIAYVAVIVGVCLLVAVILLRVVGRRLPEVLLACMKSDRLLMIAVVGVGAELACALVALSLGLPAGRFWIGLAIFCAWVAVFARVLPRLRRRLGRRTAPL